MPPSLLLAVIIFENVLLADAQHVPSGVMPVSRSDAMPAAHNDFLPALGPSQRPPSATVDYQLPTGGIYTHWFQEIEVLSEYHPGSYFGAVRFPPFGYAGVQTLPSMPAQFFGQVIFSIWDHGCRDLNSFCPQDQRAEVLETGKGVRIKRFGSEGTGFQARMEVWKIQGLNSKKPEMFDHEKFQFLVVAEQDVVNGVTSSTTVIYTGYFRAPSITGKQDWCLLAKIRVGTGGYPWSLNGLSSFVEHFLPTGIPRVRDVRALDFHYSTRTAAFGPSYVMGQNGVWSQITQATFSANTWTGSDSRKARAWVENATPDRWILEIGNQASATSGPQQLHVNRCFSEPPEFTQIKSLISTYTLPSYATGRGCLGDYCPPPWFFGWEPPWWFNKIRRYVSWGNTGGIFTWYIVTALITLPVLAILFFCFCYTPIVAAIPGRQPGEILYDVYGQNKGTVVEMPGRYPGGFAGLPSPRGLDARGFGGRYPGYQVAAYPGYQVAAGGQPQFRR